LLIGLRAFTLSNGQITRRKITDIPVSELFWLLIVTVFILGPYTRLYGVWHILLLVRHSHPWQVLAIFSVSLVVQMVTMATWDFTGFGNGIALTMIVVAVFAARTLQTEQGQSVSAYFSR
ncbi:MAG: hypothetical protein AAF125_11495, partial [Chloroflexota bacterium]